MGVLLSSKKGTPLGKIPRNVPFFFVFYATENSWVVCVTIWADFFAIGSPLADVNTARDIISSIAVLTSTSSRFSLGSFTETVIVLPPWVAKTIWSVFFSIVFPPFIIILFPFGDTLHKVSEECPQNIYFLPPSTKYPLVRIL